MTQTALDEFVVRTRRAVAFNPNGLDWNVGVGRMLHEDEFNAALQDPRYLAFCKEQDRREAQASLDEGGLISPEDVKRSLATIRLLAPYNQDSMFPVKQ